MASKASVQSVNAPIFSANAILAFVADLRPLTMGATMSNVVNVIATVITNVIAACNECGSLARSGIMAWINGNANSHNVINSCVIAVYPIFRRKNYEVSLRLLLNKSEDLRIFDFLFFNQR